MPGSNCVERVGPRVRGLRGGSRGERTEVVVGAGDPVRRRRLEVRGHEGIDRRRERRGLGRVVPAERGLHAPPSSTIAAVSPQAGEKVPGVVCASRTGSIALSAPPAKYLNRPASVTASAGKPRLVMMADLRRGRRLRHHFVPRRRLRHHRGGHPRQKTSGHRDQRRAREYFHCPTIEESELTSVRAKPSTQRVSRLRVYRTVKQPRSVFELLGTGAPGR